VLLEAVLKVHHHLRPQSEQVLQQDNLLILQMVCIQRHEQQAEIVMEIRRFLNCSRILELHLLLELVRQITQFFIQTSEPPKALVRQRPETKQRFFTLRLEQHLQVEQVQRHLKKRAHSLEQYLMPEMVLQRQKNCEPSLELVLHQGCLIRLHLSGTEKSEQPTGMVGRPLTMKLSASTPLQEMQAQQETALQPRLHSRPL
jgi:hypothetical protein